MQPDEDRLIEQLREMAAAGATRAALQAECRGFLDGYDAIAHKAYWAYCSAHGRMRLSATFGEESFVAEHLEAWCDFLVNTATSPADSPPSLCTSEELVRTLLIGWHCPEYPLWLAHEVSDRLVILVARRAPWLVSRLTERQLCAFREPRGRLALVRAFQEGRPVFAMMDYCYDEAAHVLANFLGYPARTPAGVVVLARRYGYRIAVLAGSEDGAPVMGDSFPAAAGSVEEHTARINAVIEANVLRRAPRWLLWASVDRRWSGVDYEGETSRVVEAAMEA